MDEGLVSEGGGRDLLVRLQAAESLSDVRAVIDLLLRRFRFEFFKLFDSRVVSTAPLRSQLLISNVPLGFIDGFDALGGVPAAPVRVLMASERLTFQWHVDDIAERAATSPQAAELMTLLRNHGMCRGVHAALPTIDGRKHIFGVFGERDALSAGELDEFSFLAIHVLDRMETLEKRRLWHRTGISGLEVECLEMAAAGLDTAAMAQRLSLSARTVNYLVASLCRKLGTDRLEHALGEAVRLGYLS